MYLLVTDVVPGFEQMHGPIEGLLKEPDIDPISKTSDKPEANEKIESDETLIGDSDVKTTKSMSQKRLDDGFRKL